jgi:hypothetical protein
MGDGLVLYREPGGQLVELLRQRCRGVGRTGEAPIAQVPKRFLPRLAGRLHLPRQRRARPLFARRRAHHHPALAGGRLGGSGPGQRTVAVLVPGVVGHRQRGAGCRGGVGDATDPAHPRRREAGDVVRAVQPTIRHEDRRRRFVLVLGAQLLGERFHRGDQAELVTGVAVERLAV